jgi:L-fucose isomerase-like protein
MNLNTTLAVIVGNRGFFPNHLCASGREIILKVLAKHDIRAVILDTGATKFGGSVETLADAHVCADLFKRHRDEIDGVLVTLPNFGDERAVSNTIRWSGLEVPVLVHAFADDPKKMTLKDRRDSFCGKMSACNNLRQYGIPYSLTDLHTVNPESADFDRDLKRFAATCRVVRSLKNLRIGVIGARPAAFNTVRYSEKLLEASGISVETLDLSEILGWANRMKDADAPVRDKIAAIKAYTKVQGVPDAALLRIAKLAAAVDRWMKDQEVTATAIQCWTSIEEFYGVVPCTMMSMMSNSLHSSACETDIGGLLGMHVMAAASGKPSALLDWNNNYGAEKDKGVVFHCSNFPKDWFIEHSMDYQDIIAGTVGKDNTYGTIVGRVKPGPFTFCRLSTDDGAGKVRGYVGEGTFTEELLQHICRGGFEHHVAGNLSQVAAAVHDALATYKGWDMCLHGA